MKYEERSRSDSWLSSLAPLEAMTAIPAVARRVIELNEKSAVGSAPLMREMAPL